MPKPRKLNLETSTARLKLKIQKKPYRSRLGPGLSLGYRRNEGPGTWSVIAADGPRPGVAEEDWRRRRS